MDTQVRTPQAIFGQPRRFVVPLFQRPYTWNEDLHWQPLWFDLERVAIRLLREPQAKHTPHFLGAVVLQQVHAPVGDLPRHTIIDGQQRLTTLQILFDALHAELDRAKLSVSASKLEVLVSNDAMYRVNPEDRFKVWPTNRDRAAFAEVMSAEPPVDHASLKQKQSRLVHAHAFFCRQSREWLRRDGTDQIEARAKAIEVSARELLQLVVIDLTAEENAQDIFETLNARGAQLTAADLIKNFVFQKLLDSKVDVEKAYENHWRTFESAFWETEVSAGRIKHQRSSLFINHWLISRTGDEIVAREVFERFKRFAQHEANAIMTDLLQQMSRASTTYRRVTEAVDNKSGTMDAVGLFSYRIGVMEIDVMKSVLLALLDEERPTIPTAVVESALATIESWLVRRMLVRGSTNVYNQMAAELVSIIRQTEPEKVAQAIRSFLANQSSENRYWPDDDDVTSELKVLQIYRRMSRSRLRMVLEALEDFSRGFRAAGKELAGARVLRREFHIEHVMPQGWEHRWPAPSKGTPRERSERVQRLGNLTLLTAKLNSSVSNSPWAGEKGKRLALHQHDVLLLNREVDAIGGEDWNDESIERRTAELIDRVLKIWPVPAGYKSTTAREAAIVPRAVEIEDLINADLLQPGQVLTPKSAKDEHRTAVILADGRIEFEGRLFDSPSGAGFAIRQRATNGWYFWLVDAATKKPLTAVRREYLESISASEPNAEVDEDLDDE